AVTLAARKSQPARHRRSHRFVEERRGNRNENSSTSPSPDYANQLPNRPPSAPGSSSLAFFLVPQTARPRRAEVTCRVEARRDGNEGGSRFRQPCNLATM